MPSFHEARKRGLLHREEINLKEAVRGRYKELYLAVSHRWETSDSPDPTGQQASKLLTYLRENADGQRVSRVWFEYASHGLASLPRVSRLVLASDSRSICAPRSFSCMPQGHRTPEEQAEFETMLKQVPHACP